MKKRAKRSTTVEKVKTLEAKTDNQREYIRSIVENDVIFCSGPSGSGKSFIAAGIASQHLHRNNIEKVIITRPMVCAGEKMGSLPGDVSEKIHPYLLPMNENFQYFLGPYYGEYCRASASGPPRIVHYPLELMRGSTFHNSYMILDEAQNCTFSQIKMFITRMGQGSKVLINGDTNQTDLREKSGLDRCIKLLDGIEGVGIVTLGYEDIQRNGILGRILTALESE
jgi:phosphate starvation-inducible protein PhoH and related proteins